MKNFAQIIPAPAIFFFFNSLHAQVAPSIEWQKCLGGSKVDIASSIQQTADNGYIVAGSSSSNDGDVSGNKGTYDYWIVKLDMDGNLVWQKSLGGSSSDEATSIQQTATGEFIVAGHSSSNDGDVTGNHGYSDCWIVKLDVIGNILWQKCLGGSGIDWSNSIEETTDGGFIMAGYSISNNGDVTGNHGESDYWIVKLDISGNMEWQKCLGGSNSDWAKSIQQTADSGFIVAGSTWSNDGDVSGNQGSSDYWIVKLDAMGNISWQKTLGGSYLDAGFSVQQTADGGYIAAGSSYSNDGDITGHHGLSYYPYAYPDYWIVKLDMLGNLVWQKSLGGYENDLAFAIQQTADGGFIVAGYATGNEGDVTGNHGAYDSWIVKLDTSGNLVWHKCLGGSGGDWAESIQQSTDGGFIVAGSSDSNDGDVTGNHGAQEYWIVKLSSDTTTGISSPSNNSVSLYPNPVQTNLTLDLSTPADDVNIRVYDVQGRMMILPLTVNNTQVQLDVSTLPDGIFMLQIINNTSGRSDTGKFVKKH